MSFIRMGQKGSYVEIPGGSAYYLYDNGTDIEGWSYEEFAALIAGVLDEIEWDSSGVGPDGEVTYSGAAGRIKFGFANYFGGLDEEYSGGITPPERGEIFCQCVDSRIDSIELSDELQEAVQDWADEYEAMVECDYCGTEFRPYFKGLSDTNVCDKDECSLKREADSYDVSVATVEREERIFQHLHYDYDWSLEDASNAATDYLLEQSPRDFNEEAKELDNE